MVYNQKDYEGLPPVFRASSSEKVEIFLRAGLADLETSLGDEDDCYTLLHHCLGRFQVSQHLVRCLRGQWLKPYHGYTPLVSVFERNADGPVKIVVKSEGGPKARTSWTSFRMRKTDAGLSHGPRSVPQRINRPLLTGTPEQTLELFVQNPDLSPSEVQHIYKICLRHKIFSVKLSEVLCPMLAKENYGMWSILFPLSSRWLTLLLLKQVCMTQ